MDARHVVRAWELGEGRPLAFRALLLLALVFPEKTRRELAQESLGRRNAELFSLREKLFGPELLAFVRCPHCQTAVEFAVSTRDLCTARADLATPRAGPWRQEDYELEVRAPTSLDLPADEEASPLVSETLARRCIGQARRAGEPVPVEAVPARVLAELTDNLTLFDPHLETRLNMDCPVCRKSWLARFDIVSFLWAEIVAHAKLLCGQVHAMAAAYGWREMDILAMSAARRELYLQML